MSKNNLTPAKRPIIIPFLPNRAATTEVALKPALTRANMAAYAKSFCNSLDLEDKCALALLITAFKKDRSLIPQALFLAATQKPQADL